MLENELIESKENEFLSLNKLLFLIALTWLLSGIALYFVPEHGTFGDMFGAVNALFSGLAFGSLIYTIFLQRHELRLQREELGLTRKELKGQKLQLSAQNEVMKIQNFENTFFQMLKLLNDIINAIDIQSNDKVTRGRDCFVIFLRRLEYEHHKYKKDLNYSDRSVLDLIKLGYRDFYLIRQGEVGHYYRTLYNIIKFIKESKVKNKTFYTNLVRAQLSNQELVLMFYNCLSDHGSEKFKPLIEEFSLLKNMSADSLMDKVNHYSLYEKSAYGK